MAALTDVDLANRALSMIAARNQITSLTEDSVEAISVNMFYNTIRDQVMTMAPWNFVRRTELLSLMKAAPGTPENPVDTTPWNSSNPAPPWLYEYRYPDDCLFFRYLTYQPNAQVSIGTAPLTSAVISANSFWPGPPQKFIIASDFNVRATITAISKANPCLVTASNSFSNGNRVTLSDILGMVELNANTYLVANRTASNFTLQDLNGTAVDSTNFTTYTSGGFASAQAVKCILTDVQFALGIYNAQIVDPSIWPPEFVNAFTAALAAFIAFPISGKLDLKDQLLGEANSMIVEARRVDGNESLTVQDHVPDWMRIRGMNYPRWWNYDWMSPYPPLFSVS